MDQLEDRTWRKSSYSGSNGGNCIEITTAPGTVAVRDSTNPHGPVLAFTGQDWQQFTDQVKAAPQLNRRPRQVSR
jgi:uncharacterized protein DUF397